MQVRVWWSEGCGRSRESCIGRDEKQKQKQKVEKKTYQGGAKCRETAATACTQVRRVDGDDVAAAPLSCSLRLLETKKGKRKRKRMTYRIPYLRRHSCLRICVKWKGGGRGEKVGVCVPNSVARSQVAHTPQIKLPPGSRPDHKHNFCLSQFVCVCTKSHIFL